KIIRRILVKALAVCAIGLLATFSLAAATVTVDSHDDIDRAGGNDSGSGGQTPAAAATFTAGAGQVLTFSSVTGSWTCDGASFRGPDGGSCFTTGSHVGTVGSISGVDGTDYNSAVYGVFLDDGLPASAPSALRFYFSDSSQGGTQTNFAS